MLFSGVGVGLYSGSLYDHMVLFKLHVQIFRFVSYMYNKCGMIKYY